MLGGETNLADSLGFPAVSDDPVRLLRAVIETVPAGLVVLGGEDFRARWVNAAFARMLEVPWRTVDLRLHHAADFLPRAVENGLVELFKHVSVSRIPHIDPEYVYHGFASGVRYWNMSILPLVTEGRESCDLLVAISDATPQVLARDHLEGLAANAEYSLSQLEAIVNSMGEGLIVGDATGNVVTMNPAAMRIHGFTSIEQIRRPLREFADTFEVSYPDGRPIAVEDWPLARALRGEQFAGYEIHVRRVGTGRTYIGNFNGTPVRNADGDIVMAIITFRDVTRQHQAERERAQLLAREQAARAQAEISEQRYRDLADAMPQIVWTARPDGYLDYYNKRWFEYTGISREQTYSPDGWKNVLHPDDVKLCLNRWYQAVRTGEAYDIEYRFRRALDGSYRWHLGRALPLRDEQGRIVKWFGTCTDIDDQKRTEEALKDAKEAAEAADRAKDQFLAVLSHELRTPLTPVLSGIQALQSEGEIPADTRSTIDMIRRNVELEARLIDDLLDLTKIARGKLQLDMEIVDLHQIVNSVVEMCAADCRHKELRLLVDLRARRHHVRGDPARLHQVMWNLLKNAIKFTPPGGSIVVRSQAQDECMKLDVIDTGIGIESETIPRIFHAFEQANASIAQRFGGLGLGLAISKSLIDMHGGTLRASSEGFNHGSTFSMELLTTEALVAQIPTPAEAPDLMTGRGLRILMVDDHEDTSSALKRLLVRFGYDVQLANSVQSALEAAATEPFDLIISDIGLPDGSGLDLMRELCARQPIQGIALSRFGMEDDLRTSHEAGFHEHLIKPINVQKLQAVIQKVMESAVESGAAAEE